MNKGSKMWLFILPLVIGGALQAADTPPPAPQAAQPMVMDNKFIDQQLANLDNMEKRQAEMAKTIAMQPEGQKSKMRDERMALEKKMIGERRSFLIALKSQPVEGRQAAWRDFSKKQSDQRRAFMEQHRPEMEAMKKEREAHMEKMKQAAPPPPAAPAGTPQPK